MLTEDDLKIALLEFIEHNEPDEHAVRAEIEHRLTGSPRIFVTRPRWTVLVSVAACIAVALAIVLGVHLTNSRRATPPASTKTPDPTGFGALLYPGTTVVAKFHGTGSQQITLGQHTVPGGSELAVEVTCEGKGGIDVGHRFSTNCSDKGSAGGSLPSGARTLQLTVSAGTTWKVALVVQPDPRMNGSVGYPDFVFTDGSAADPTALGASTGQGNGTLALRPASPSQAYQIWLMCTGDGVTITSTSKSVKNDYTKTCFAGWDYRWEVAKGTVPPELNVTAAAGTTWKILVLPALS